MRDTEGRCLDYDEAAGVVVLSFPFDRQLNEVIKTEIPGIRWDKESRRWVVSPRQARVAARVLASRGFQPSEAFIRGFGQCTEAGIKASATHQVRADNASTLLEGGRGGEGGVVLTVEELVFRIKRSLAAAFPEPVWVMGTLLGFDKVALDVHPRFNLADWDEVTSKPTCQADVVVFRDVYAMVKRKCREAAIDLRDTLPVLFKVRIGLWEAVGRLQFYVEDVEPAFTVGRVLKNLDAIYGRLVREAVADNNLRLPWPDLPLRIGLISTPKDGYADFVRILSLSGLPFEVSFIEARVQGPHTSSTVKAALAALSGLKVDCIAIVRGGGANADLSWFNDYELGQAICACKIPVIAGIGHDRDQTLPDRLGRSRSNPTAVAEFLVRQVQSAFALRQSRIAGAVRRAEGKLGLELSRILRHADRLHFLVGAIHDRHRQRLLLDRHALGRLPSRLVAMRARMAQHQERIVLASRGTLRLAANGLPMYRERLSFLLKARIDIVKLGLKERHQKLEARDPVKLLARGYARVTSAEGRPLRRICELSIGDRIRLRMADGFAMAAIEALTNLPSGND